MANHDRSLGCTGATKRCWSDECQDLSSVILFFPRLFTVSLPRSSLFRRLDALIIPQLAIMDDSKPFQSLSSHSSILDDFENLTIDQSKACARVCQSLPLSSQTKSRKSSSPRPSHTITYSSPVQVRSRPPHVSREEYALLLAGQPATPSAADVAELRGEDANEKGCVSQQTSSLLRSHPM